MPVLLKIVTAIDVLRLRSRGRRERRLGGKWEIDLLWPYMLVDPVWLLGFGAALLR